MTTAARRLVLCLVFSAGAVGAFAGHLTDAERIWLEENFRCQTGTPELARQLEEMAGRSKALAAGRATRRGGYADVGDVAVFENDGLLVIGNFVNTIEIMNRFLATHRDQYDIINIATHYTAHDPQVTAFYQAVSNDVQGIGMGVFGSTFLKGIINMQNLDKWPTDGLYINVLGEEAGHRWGADIELPTPASCNQGNPLLLGRQCAHWSFYNASYRSYLEGNEWVEGPPGTFTMTGSGHITYSEFDEYLIGLRLASAVTTPMFAIQSPTNCVRNGNPVTCPPGESGYSSGGTYVVDGTRFNFTMTDIINVYGPRIPDATTSPKTFRMAFILIVDEGNFPLPPADPVFQRYDALRGMWEAEFAAETGSLGAFDTRLYLPSEPPNAAFDAAPRETVPNQPVQFTDRSANAPATYLWTFGDGGTSAAANPTHAYAAPGTYDVSLTVGNGNGNHTRTYTGFVTVEARAPRADFEADDTFSPTAPLTVTFTNRSTWNAGASYLWEFGDGGTSTAVSPSHTYTGNGGYTVKLTATNAFGSNTRGIPSYVNVGSLGTIYTEGFETGAPGWTHAMIATRDDWTLGNPATSPTLNPYDPLVAHGGSNIYGQAITFANRGYYVVDAENYLQSGVINASAATNHVVLDYYRWLTIEDGVYDTLEILAGGPYPAGRGAWKNPGGGGADQFRDRAWTPHAVDITTAAAGNAALQLRFQFASDGAGNFGGMNIDDLTLYHTQTGPPSPGGRIVAGPGAGSANPNSVSIHDRTGRQLTTWAAYGAGSMGTNVAGGDVDGDVFEEVLTAPGPGQTLGPQIRGFNAWDGSAIAKINFYAYGTLKYGANVTSGDVDGDRFQEIVTGPGGGPVFGPHVRGWNFDGGSVTAIAKINFFAYGTLKFGCLVSDGDVEADGFEEMLTGAGPGIPFGPHLRGWDYDNVSVVQVPNMNGLVFATTQYGVNVGSGDFDRDSDNRAEVVGGHGPGPTFSALVRVFNYTNANAFQAFPTSDLTPFTSLFGVRVAGGDLEGGMMTAVSDDTLIAAGGPDPAATARTRAYVGSFTPTAGSWTALELDFVPYGTMYGATVAAGQIQ